MPLKRSLVRKIRQQIRKPRSVSEVLKPRPLSLTSNPGLIKSFSHARGAKALRSLRKPKKLSRSFGPGHN